MRSWLTFGILLVFALSLLQASYMWYKVDNLVSQAKVTGNTLGTTQGITVICINHPPELGVPCSPNATVNVTYTCWLNGSDADNATQNLTFGALFSNGTLFNINSTTGFINFTPNSSQIGDHMINFTLQDNSTCDNNLVYQLFNLSINSSRNRGPILTKNISDVTLTEGQVISAFFLTNYFTDPDGDPMTFTVSSQAFFIITIMGTSEVIINASTCGNTAQVIFTAMDPYNETADSNLVSITCTVPPQPTPTTSGGGGGGGGQKCLSKFTCFDQTPCGLDGNKTKRCVDENGCRDDTYITVICKPPVQEECVESWSCSEWGECLVNGKQYRTCSDANGCRSPKHRPKEEQSCKFLPGCFDGLKDGDEEGIDCGGSCRPCLALETPGFIQEDLRPITYVLLVLTIIGFAGLLANKFYHKQIHHWLVKGGWYLSGRYAKAILLNPAVKKYLLEELNSLMADIGKTPAAKLFDKISELMEVYYKEAKITPRTSPHYKRAKIKRVLSGPLESVLDLFYGHIKHIDKKGWPDKDLIQYAIEEFRALINLTSSSETKVPYDVSEVKIDEFIHPADKVRLKIVNTWIALQFNEVDLARERYENLIEVYESLDNRSKLGLYGDVYRLYQEIKYANSVLDIEA